MNATNEKCMNNILFLIYFLKYKISTVASI